jgi:23S rRNA (guanosine2251-2'-O)-methyltransferase
MSQTLIGKNAVLSALQAGRPIHRIVFARGIVEDEKVEQIRAIAHELKIGCIFAERRDVDRQAKNEQHQGVIAFGPSFRYSELEDVFARAEERNEKPFILILEELEDPYNVGSLIRSAVGAGVHGVIVPEHKQADITAVVVKVSTGATEYIPIVRVKNINQTIRGLKEKGVWIFGTHQNAPQTYIQADFDLPLALVIGNEGKGMSKLVREQCDFMVKIPIRKEGIDSLNASVAGSIILFKVVEGRQRGRS